MKLPFSNADKPIHLGKLAVIGGRLEIDNLAVFGEMHRLSHGRIAIFSTASSEPEIVGAELVEEFMGHGFTAVHIPLTVANSVAIAHDPQWIARLLETGSAYFSGGDQANIINALAPKGQETPLLLALRKMYGDGGLIAGSSAGAAMMSHHSILGGTSVEAVIHGVSEDPLKPGLLIGSGLGFFDHGLVDQHFVKRGRIGRMMVALLHTGEPYGYGIDENTAMFIEGSSLSVVGEHGMLLVDGKDAQQDAESGRIDGFYVSYLDNGDSYDLLNHKATLHDDKKKVCKSKLSYRSAGKMNRGIFGAYAFREVMFRLAEADTSHYNEEAGTAYDHESEIVVNLTLHLDPLVSKAYRAFDASLRSYSYSVLKMRVNISTAPVSEPERRAWLQENEPRLLKEDAPMSQHSRVLLLGGALDADSQVLLAYLKDNLKEPVGIIAAASSDPRYATRAYEDLLSETGLATIDLDVTSDNSLYQSQSEALQTSIGQTSTFMFLGGNQQRLVDTLQYRGEDSKVLKALLDSYQAGATLVAVGAAAAAFAPVMIAGGSSYEALQYGEAIDSAYRGLELEAGLGIFTHGLVDQNLARRCRLGRLIVATAKEKQRFGFGLLEGSGLMELAKQGQLQAVGDEGFLVVDMSSAEQADDERLFSVKGLQVHFVRPGAVFDTATGTIILQAAKAPADISDKKAIDFDWLLSDLQEEYQRNQQAGQNLTLEVVSRSADGVGITLDLQVVRVPEVRRSARE